MEDIKLKSSNYIDWESHDFECHFFSDKDDLNSIITSLNPAVYTTTGNSSDYGQLFNAPYSIRRRWIHVDEFSADTIIGDNAYTCFIDSSLNVQKNLADPLVSCFPIS